jgi:hypothetical protein
VGLAPNGEESLNIGRLDRWAFGSWRFAPTKGGTGEHTG